MAREHRVDHLRNNRVVESHDAGEQRLVLLQPADQILAQLVFHGALGKLGSQIFVVSKCSEGLGKAGGRFIKTVLLIAHSILCAQRRL